MTASAPSVTVLMAVYNGERFLRVAIDSVLAQDYAEFEFVIVDDASTDATSQIVEEAKRRSSRVILIRNPANIGLTRSLNVGLEAAGGTYVARIDADDVCRRDRLARQTATMEAEPSLTIIGSGYRIIDGEGRSLGAVREDLNPRQVSWLLGFSPPCFHPTYFFRRLQPDGTPVLYDPNFRTAQDFDLWSRLAALGPTRVLGEPLIDYRRHTGGISVQKRTEQARAAMAVSERNLRARLPNEIVEAIQPLTDLLTFRAEARGARIDGAADAARVLLVQDRDFLPSQPEKDWMRRTTAALLADAVLSRGGALRRPDDLARFLWQARDFLFPLASAVARRPATARKSIAAILSRQR